MAKKKTMSSSDIATVNKQIIKDFGDVVRTGNELFDDIKDRKLLPISPAIDYAIGGGIQAGSLVQLAGKPKSGKTTTAIQYAANCQKEENGSRPIIYFDVEARVGRNQLEGIEGLDRDNIHFIIPQDGVLAAEDDFRIMEHYIKNVKNCVVIIDSVSTMASRDELDYKFDKQFRNPVMKMMSSFTKKIAHILPQQRAVVISINHIIADSNPHTRSTTMVDGGNKLKYAANYILHITHTRPWEESNEIVGQEVNWKVVTSHAGGFPNTPVTSYLRYGKGLDWRKELVDQCSEIPLLIEKAGAWYYLNFVKEEGQERGPSCQGYKKCLEYLNENNLWEKLKKEHKEIFG